MHPNYTTTLPCVTATVMETIFISDMSHVIGLHFKQLPNNNHFL